MTKLTAAPEALLDEPTAHRADGDEMDEEEVARLNDAIDESAAQFARGEGIPAEVVLVEMRRILYSE
jgi:hypothetical protein